MKFSDGLWLTKCGYQVAYAAQAYTIREQGSSLTVLATASPVYNRAMTLGGVTLEITYTAVAEDVIKVHIVHHKGVLCSMPQFELQEPEVCQAKITDTGEYIELHAGRTSVRVYRGFQWRVDFLRDGKRLTGADGRSTSYITEDAYHAKSRVHLQHGDRFFNAPADKRTSYTREQLSLGVGECMYGFGEKFTAFVKNGQTADIWNADGGTCSEQSYKSIPFCLSNRRYGIFVNSTGMVSFEVGSDTVAKLSMTLPGEELEYYFFGGDTPEQVLERYTDLTGKPALPPASSFGLWLSTSFTTDYDEKTVNSFVDGMAQRDIPLSMFHFDCFWMKEFTWTSFRWDADMFPDPAAQIRRLHERGLGVCVWVNPYIAQQAPVFAECVEHDYFLHNPDGSVFQCDLWQPGMALIDFTNPAAYRWFGEQIIRLAETGVDAVKTDFGERIPTDVVYYDGSDPIGMHNYYTYLYNRCAFEALQSVRGAGNTVLFARSATAGGQKFPVHWGGDCTAAYTSMAETLRGGLSLTASGFGFFSHDIGGFEQNATADVYKRWCAFGLMSTHSRLHGANTYRVPWLYEEDTPDDPENACAVLRFFTKLKGRLMPYLYAQAVRTHETGIPMMRATVLHYPDDPAAAYLDRQYLLGDSLLCAPVMNAEGTADVYLPAGVWTDILTGEQAEGGRFYCRKCSFLQMPIYAAPDAIIVYGSFQGNAVYDYVQDAEAVIYHLAEGHTAETTVCNAEGKPEITITAENNNGTVSVHTTPTDKTFTVRLHGRPPVTLGGGRTDAELV